MGVRQGKAAVWTANSSRRRSTAQQQQHGPALHSLQLAAAAAWETPSHPATHPPTFAKVRDCTSTWSASHSGHLSEIITITLSGLPALSVLHTPAGGEEGRRGGVRACKIEAQTQRAENREGVAQARVCGRDAVSICDLLECVPSADPVPC